MVEKMKIAIVQDGLMCKAGGEQVALAFHNAFPKAPIFTLAYNKRLTFPDFKKADVRPSLMQYISNNENIVKKLFFPLGLLASHLMDLRKYNVILMSTTHCAKYIRVSENAMIFCYAHNPFRLAWYPEEYNISRYGMLGNVVGLVSKGLKMIDKNSIKKVDHLITNSHIVKGRLRQCYTNYTGEITIIPPPVSMANFFLSTAKKEYFLVVSRLEVYKKVDLVVETFNNLGLPLVVVGKGSMEAQLKKLATNHIIFHKDLTSDDLAKIYAGARAFIFPQLEDFGITPLEANASGLPVIAFGEGGVLDTQIPVINGINSKSDATAIFFDEQTVESLTKAIHEYISIEETFSPKALRRHAESFDQEHFIKKIQEFVNLKALQF
jgi:glycosyltransferase involved in cell wall biosynthesis